MSENSFDTETVSIIGNLMGETSVGFLIPKSYGLCSKCKYACIRKTSFPSEEVICLAHRGMSTTWIIKPNKITPITDCSSYYPSGHPELWEMEKLATFIDVEKKKKKVRTGFSNSKEKEEFEIIVTSSKPCMNAM